MVGSGAEVYRVGPCRPTGIQLNDRRRPRVSKTANSKDDRLGRASTARDSETPVWPRQDGDGGRLHGTGRPGAHRSFH